MATFDVTIDHTKVADDLTDFPVLIDLADMPVEFWSTVTSGGGDIRVTDAAEQPLAREVVSCDVGMETGELWVKCDLSSTVDTEITVEVDGVSTEPAASATYGSQAVWSNGYAAVWHLDGMADSTANANDGINFGSTAAVGPWGACREFSAGTRIHIPRSASLDLRGDLTVSAHVKADTAHASPRSGIFTEGYRGAGGGPYDNNVQYELGIDADLEFGTRPMVGSYVSGAWSVARSTTPIDDAWRSLSGVHDGTTFRIYTDGVAAGTGTAPATLPAGADNFMIGRMHDTYSFIGRIDEVRVSSVARTADWIATEHANQSNPAGFYLVDGLAPSPALRPAVGTLQINSPAPLVTQRDQYFTLDAATLDAATLALGSPSPVVQNHGQQTIVVKVSRGSLRLSGGGIMLASQEVAIDWDAPAAWTVSGLHASLTTPPIPEVVPTPSAGSGFTVTIVDNQGGTTGGLSAANVKEIIWTLNDSDQATVEVPKYGGGGMAKPVVDCLKIGFNGATLFNGPIIPRGATSSGGVITYRARGVDWFLTKRRLGMPPVAGPYLPNGGFELRNAHWAIRQGHGSAVVQPGTALGGRRLLRMRWEGPPKEGSPIAHKAPAALAGYSPNAPFMGRWTVEAWCRIISMYETVGSGHLLRLAGTPGTIGDTFLPDDAPRGKWFRVTADAICGPGGVINVTLFGIGGVVDWDEVRLFDSGTWGPVGWHTDTAEVAKIAVDAAQARSDFGLGTAVEASGVEWPEAEWQVADHTTWDQIVRALAAYGDGFDWSVDPDSRTWTSHVPRKGVDRGITLVPGTHIASYNWDDDGSQLVSALIVQGQGPDGNKTESGYTNAGMFDGIELHDVLQADEGTPIDDLPKTAKTWVDESEFADDQLTVVCHCNNYDFITGVDTGDRVGVSISDGGVQLSGQWRIIQKKLNGHDLTVEFTLIKEP